MSQIKKAVVIGGTGATGQQLIKQLLANDKWEQITSIGRKPVLNGKGHDKLQDIVLETLYDLSSTEELWKGHDVFFNCIGTTRKRAGSAKKFIEIVVIIFEWKQLSLLGNELRDLVLVQHHLR